jgi:hypothetical protein
LKIIILATQSLQISREVMDCSTSPIKVVGSSNATWYLYAASAPRFDWI